MQEPKEQRRKPGGQPGHPGSGGRPATRELLPPDEKPGTFTVQSTLRDIAKVRAYAKRLRDNGGQE